MIRVVVFQGPSGVGKTTLQRKIGIPKVVTWTTRVPRDHERDGIDYHFVDVKTFRAMCDDGQMLEFTQYKSNFYGSTVKSITDKVGPVKSIVLDARGARRVKTLLQDECLVVGVYAEETDCKERLMARGESPELLEQRIRDYQSEISQLWQCDIILNNSTGNWTTVNSVLNMIRNGLSAHKG